MKLVVAGGGGFRVPLVYDALLGRAGWSWSCTTSTAGAWNASGGCSRGSRPSAASAWFRATTDLDDALEGADFVFAAIRPGGLEGRVIDEAVPLELGVLGQETTGPGGICFALRTSRRWSRSRKP